MFATLSTAWVLPGVIGPALAGIVTETLGWRGVFLGLLPLIVLSGAMTLRRLMRGPRAGAARTTRMPPRAAAALGASRSRSSSPRGRASCSPA